MSHRAPDRARAPSGAPQVFSTGTGGLTATGPWTFDAGTFGGPYLDARYGTAIDE
ncbi:hypothetical protein [Streptomyces sp. Qhu_M48]|uniref:hypothetical protein n=1 Tax=Streptomyces sp. Qhu_M48 TaxID=3435889 RepID=UPI003F4FF227